jgi:hypothetical protein
MTASLQRLTCLTSARFRARAPGPVSGQLCSTPAENRTLRRWFPAAFRPPAFASWASCPARGFRPSYDRPTALASADPSGVSMFRTRETRLGPGALFTPGTAVPTRPVNLPDRRTPPFIGRSLFTPVNHSAPGCNCDEASSRVHWRSPLPAFPSPVIPGTVRGPSGFSLSSAPG